LQTNARIGYVVIDVDSGDPAQAQSLRRKLEEVPGTIRVRVLY
jgi:D-3-phosphoglycerate dehydrogenase